MTGLAGALGVVAGDGGGVGGAGQQTGDLNVRLHNMHLVNLFRSTNG